MTIQEAAKKAQEKGTGIYRANKMESLAYIVPTNTCACCICVNIKPEQLFARWQPQLRDLIADDWEVYGVLGNEFREEINNA